jgi:hypothetical protein
VATAIERFESTLERAGAERAKAVAAARKEHVTELRAALDAAMSRADADEANRIKAEIDQAEGGSVARDRKRPAPARVVASEKKLDRIVLAAGTEFRRLGDAARRKYLDELDAAKTKSLKELRDLDLANELAAEIARVKSLNLETEPQDRDGGRGRDTGGNSDKGELLGKIVLSRDVKKGEWEMTTNGLLTAGDAAACRLHVPCDPPPEYDLTVEFTVVRAQFAGDFGQGFEFQGRRLNWILGGWNNKWSAFNFKGGKSRFAVHRDPFFENGRRYKSEIRVRKTGVAMLLDGRQVFTDPVAELAVIPAGDPGVKIAFWAYSSVLIHSIRVTPADTPRPNGERAIAPVTARAAVNLLHKVDTDAADLRRGPWKWENDALRSGDQEHQWCQVRYRPPAEYDLEVEFTRQAGNDLVGLILPVAEGQDVMLFLGGYGNKVTGFDVVDGQAGGKNVTNRRVAEGCLTNGRKYKGRVEVRRDAVRAFLDGEQIVSLDPRKHRFEIFPKWQTRPGLIGVASFWSPTSFHSIRVVEQP